MLAALLGTLPLPGCAYWFFSGTDKVDRTHPVALVETRGGVEYGATTEIGILTLGRSATEGPCRVHYWLGPTPIIEDGELLVTGSVFNRADIDLQTQQVRIFDRYPTVDDELVAMWTTDGRTTQSVGVELAQDPGVTGSVLADPGVELPAGAAIFADFEGKYRFVGLVSARASVSGGAAGDQTYYTFAGLDRVRELLAVPEIWPKDFRAKFRPDDIIIMKPVR